MVAVCALELDDERRSIRKQREHLVKERDLLVRSLEAELF